MLIIIRQILYSLHIKGAPWQLVLDLHIELQLLVVAKPDDESNQVKEGSKNQPFRIVLVHKVNLLVSCSWVEIESLGLRLGSVENVPCGAPRCHRDRGCELQVVELGVRSLPSSGVPLHGWGDLEVERHYLEDGKHGGHGGLGGHV